jgi:hypothetical protein
MNRTRAIRFTKLGLVAIATAATVLFPELFDWAGRGSTTLATCLLVLLAWRLKVDSWPLVLTLAVVPAVHLALGFALSPSTSGPEAGQQAALPAELLPIVIGLIAYGIAPMLVIGPVAGAVLLYLLIRRRKNLKAPAAAG